MDLELTGNYPIIIDGRECGRIDVGRDGLFWSFEATSAMSDGIIRLSVFGEEGEGYLGVMEPAGERMRLKKKLSRSAIKDFPQKITHGGRQGQAQELVSVDAGFTPPPPREAAPAEAVAVAVTESEGTCKDCEADGSGSFPQNQRPPPEPAAPHTRPLVWKMCGCPASYLSTIEGKKLFGGLSNVLEAADGEYVYLALPENGLNIHPEQRKLFLGSTVIMGEPYLICKTKNGIITT